MLELGFEVGGSESGPPSSAAGPDGPLPERVGPYRLLGTLGEGGMGTVYLAEQTEPVRRRVALKVIRRGMGTREVIRRFEAERQALARMDHPSIARVYDAGETAEGRSYFAMEYVEGDPITAYCDRRRMTTSERLALLAEVCEAVQHAHRKGVIHRDLKPSNVLVTEVDGKPAPKVIDFGVAKAIEQRLTERSLFTELGMIVGTPEYMSPEQAEFTGERVDTRTDVYALGVLQYELLTGSLPFDPAELRRGGFEQLCRRIREEDPAKPSTRIGTLGESASAPARCRRVDWPTLRRELTGDLDWVTMKALAKDPERRYGSPQELADDIRRHLDHQPVSAGPPSAAYRVRKFVRRNRLAVASALSIVVVLVAGVVAATAFALREASQRRIAERARADLEQVTRFQADMIADVDVERAGANLLADLRRRLAESRPSPDAELVGCFDRGLGRINGTDAALRMIEEEFLGRASAVLDSEFDGRPAIEARLRRSLAGTYRELGSFDAAAVQGTRALELDRRSLGPHDAETLRSSSELAFIYLRQGRHYEAESMLTENLAALREELGPEDPETAAAMNDLGLLYYSQGRNAEAEKLFHEAHRSRERALGPEHPDTLQSLGNLALAYWQQGRLEQAEQTLRRTVDARRRLHQNGRGLMINVRDLGILCFQLGRFKEAEALYREALAGQERMLGRDHMDTLTTLENLAVLLDDQGRDEAAEKLYRENLEAKSRTLGRDHPNTLVSMLNLSSFLIEADRLTEAETLATEAAASLSRTLGPEHVYTLSARANLADIRARRGDRDAALREYDEIIAIARRTLGPDHPLLPQLQASLAEAYAALGMLGEAESAYREAADHPAAIAHVKDAAAQFLLERSPEDALRYAREANEMTDYQSAELIETLVRAYRELGRTDEAIDSCRRALRSLPQDHPRRADFEETLRELEAP